MYMKPLALLALLGAAQAAAHPKILSFDDVVVPNDDGSYTIMKDWEYGIQQSKQEMHDKKTRHSPPPPPPAGSLEKRCDTSEEVQVLSDIRFNNWDVAMSPVVSNSGSSMLIVSVTKGHEVSNGFTVTKVSTYTIVPEVLKASFKLSYSRTWISTDSQTFNFWVPDGQNGLVVSFPYVRRISGKFLSGCVDSPDAKDFASDTYDDQNYSGLAWVKGPIVLCNSTEYPVPFCNGQGVHK